MRIKYVVSIMVFWGRQNRLSLEQECEFLKSMGFGVELWPNTGGINECLYDRRNWPRLAAATEGMVVSMRSRNDNPSLDQWAEQIKCAKLLKSNIVADLQSLKIQGRVADNGDLLRDVVSMAQNEGIELSVETGPIEVLKEIGDKFDSVRYCLDTGFTGSDDEHTFRDYIDALAGRTAHLHLAESFNGFDSPSASLGMASLPALSLSNVSNYHRPLGCHCGISREDWDYLLKALDKSDNDIIGAFEMTPCTPAEMIHRSSHFLFDVLNWPNPPKK
jgi:sugar phosphate isomerase/epimerase